MDIFLHILIIVIIGAFFFIDKYSTSFNPMFFVIILTILGFIFLQTSTIDYIDYNSVEKINSSYYQHPTTDISNIGVGIFNVNSFILLTYWFFMILGVLNIILGKKESNIRK